MNSGSLNSIQICKGALMISYLLFADDYIIFLRANFTEVGIITSVLQRYELLFGQKINLYKSKVVFNTNVVNPLENALSVELRVRLVDRHHLYLDLPKNCWS